jgi:O-antigen/teichoic acid export membrane protein
MRRHLVPLLAANVVAFASVGISYFVYSRLLTAQQFGAYAAALAIGTLAVLVLDGGIKTSIIKHTTDLSREEESSLFTAMLGFSVVLLLALYFSQDAIKHFYPAASDQTTFVSAFAAVYLTTYPWIGLSTASLERRLSYSQLAWIESIGIVLERGAPAIFLIWSNLGMESFVVGLATGRVVRIALLSRLHSVPMGWHFKKTSSAIGVLLREGLMFQLGGAASMVRDNMHVLVVGPLFGSLWVGYYAWGLQLCAISSQVFVQISARVSLSVTAKEMNFPDRWATITQQIALLTAATAPILVAVLVVAPTLDHYLFADKWKMALILLPLLCARMLPGIACTPVGTLLLVERGATGYAIALCWWTGAELAIGCLSASILGPKGLAVSYSVTAWLGVYLLLRGLGVKSRSLFWEVCGAIFRRPGLWLSIAAGVTYFCWFNPADPRGAAISVIGGILLVIGAYLVDPGFRSMLRRTQGQ